MKYLALIFACFTLTAQIPGTFRVSGPVAPPATNSNIGAQLPVYGYGGLVTGADNFAWITNMLRRPLARRHPFEIYITTNGYAYQTDFTRTNFTPINLNGIGPVGGEGTNITLNGTTTVTDVLQVFNFLDLFYDVSGAPDSAAASKLYVDRQKTVVASNLAALLATTSPPNLAAGIVLSDTASDGASGDWYFDPFSTATASSVIKIPNDRSSVTLGRWLKR